MSLDILMHEAANLDSESQRRLIGFLITLRAENSPEHREEMARRIDDRTAGSWLTLDELDAKLAVLDE